MTVSTWDGGTVPATPAPADLVPSALPPAAAALVEWANVAEAAHQLALQLCETTFVPAAYFQEPGLTTAAMLAGSELGLSPIQSLMSFDVIDGRPAPRALTLRALLERQGHQFLVDVSTAKVAKGRAKRRGTSEWQTAEYTWDEAQLRGLTRKRNWQTQPKDMLVARLTGRLARLVAADSILGIPYSADELEDMADEAAPVTVRKRGGATRVQRQGPAAGSVTADQPDANYQPPAAAAGSPPPGGADDNPDPAGPPADPAPADQAFVPPSDAQVRMMWALIGQLYGDARDPDIRDRVLADIGTWVDRAVDTTRGLTGAEVSTVIDQLEAAVTADLSPEGSHE